MKEIRAARWTPARELEIDAFRLADPGPGQAQVEVQSAGICGSDLHFFRGDFAPRDGIVPGHEFGGVVSALGKGVNHLREGDVVGVEPILRCGKCSNCRSGRYHVCASRRLIGEDADGGMSELANVPGGTAFAAPVGVDAELAALAEPLACSVHGFARARLRAGETVLVIGAGSIGLTALLAAKAAGARSLVLARHPQQREAALGLGADEVLGEDEGGRERLAELAGQDAIDVCVESVGGHADTILQAQRAVRRQGRVLVLGSFAVPTARLDPGHLVEREIEMIGSVAYGAPGGRAEYAMALELLADCADRARSLVTHRFDLEQANEAFAAALDKSSRSIKVHLNPSA